MPSARWDDNDQEYTRLGHCHLPKAANKLQVICCTPVQLAAFKKMFVSGVWLSWQQKQHVLFVWVVRNIWSSWFLIPVVAHWWSVCKKLWSCSTCFLLAALRGKRGYCGPVEGKDRAPCQWTWSLFKVLATLPETGTWLQCFGQVSAGGRESLFVHVGGRDWSCSRGFCAGAGQRNPACLWL